ncbi:MAG: hypothetical protein Q4B59_00845 [Lachnospiraceae bacterium]|nr:hypothetical protein [Lachnospiraceae bacterium]
MRAETVVSDMFHTITFGEWWETLSTSFISFYFIAFVLVLALIYYLMPKRGQWLILLIGSAAFYSLGGLTTLLTVMETAVIVWGVALCIERTDRKQKGKRKAFLILGVLILLGMLVFTKSYSLFKFRFRYVIPLGISYYTFSAIAYLADVYWNKDRAETNVLKLALFLLYFPKILQGPIARHRLLGPQLCQGHAFQYRKFCFGIQLALWGYFKKIVVADRLAVLTGAIFGNYEKYGGAVLFLAMIMAAMQLYCDFSGCMDIAGGVSEMFGIELEQNFNHPFFARSGSEFWQRWHMTLSGWFKDYLFMPVSRSGWVRTISKAVGKRFGSTGRKNTIILIASFMVWLSTGVWHGTGVPYVAWGLYWYLVTSSSTLLGGVYEKGRKRFGISEEQKGWQVFQMVRTYLIFSFGRILTIPNDLAVTGEILRRYVMMPRFWQLFDGSMLKLGLSGLECVILIFGILIVWAVDVLQTRCALREKIAGWNMLYRALFYSLAVITLLIFGRYGLGYGNTTFTYMNF